MDGTKENVFEKIGQLSEVEGFLAAKEVLTSPEASAYDPLIGDKKSGERYVKVSDIIGTWTARCHHSKKKLSGGADFIQNLQSLPGDTCLISFHFRHSSQVGVFWFLADMSTPVGFIVTEEAD